MGEILRSTVRLLGARWPELLVFSLAGTYLVELGIVGAATLAATQSTYLGLVTLPLPILVRLAAYTAMFLVLRPLLPNYQARVAAGQLQVDASTLEMSRRRRRSGEVTTFASQVIVPFFVMYSAWNFLQEDIDQYKVDIERRMFTSVEERLAVLELDLENPVVPIMLVGALLARILVHRLRNVLPVSVAALEVYLEGLWVFLLAMLVTNPLKQIPEWLAGRELFVWLGRGWDRVLDTLAPLRFLWDVVVATAAFLGEAVSTLALPIAWLAITGIVLARRLGDLTAVDLLTARSAHLRRTRARKVPGWARVVTEEVVEDYRLRVDALVDVGHVVLRGGLLSIAGFVLVYTAAEAMTGWAIRGVFWLIGPNTLAWWGSVFPGVAAVVNALGDLPQIALLAATFDHCLGRLSRQQALTPAAPGRTAAAPTA